MSVQETFPFNGSQVATITGYTKQEVLDQIESYFVQYNPRGYNTKIIQGPEENEGTWLARVRRYSSCD